MSLDQTNRMSLDRIHRKTVCRKDNACLCVCVCACVCVCMRV